MSPDYFDNKYTKWLCEKGLEYLEKFNNFPNESVVFEDLKFIIEREIPESSKKLYFLTLESVQNAELSNREFVELELENFCFTKHALLRCKEQENNILAGNFEKAKELAFDTYKPLASECEAIDLKKDYKAITEMLKTHSPVPTPLPFFNKNMKGGPGGGDLVIVCAASSMGKTAYLTATARHAAIEGYKVAYFSLETHTSQLMSRAIAGLVGVNQECLKDHDGLIESKVSEVKGEVKFIRYKATQAKTSIIKLKIEELKTQGFFPELIIIDGLNQLKLPAGKRVTDTNEKFEYLSEELRDMGSDLSCPVYAAFQTNRCLALDTLVYLKDRGKVKIIDLKEGDEILTHKGYKRVTKIYPVESQPSYKIRLKSGKEIICSGDHEFPIEGEGLISINSGLKPGFKLFTKKESKSGTTVLLMKKEFFNLDEIESIEFLGERDTIDICVEDTHMFYANDIYTHNSGFNTDFADENSIGKAIEVYQVCDVMIMLTQSIPMLEKGEAYAQLLKNRLGVKGIIGRISYNPNQGTFQEIEEVTRSVLMSKSEKSEVVGNIGKIRDKLDKYKCAQ